MEKLFQAKTIPEYVEVANQFERISNIEKTEWLPLYYASFAYIMISFQETENVKKDQNLDQAQNFLDQALAIVTLRMMSPASSIRSVVASSSS